MIVTLATGTAFAVVHHLFYVGLDTQKVSTANITIAGINTSQQQLNINIGTAFAFLVKAFLATSVGIAFVQVFWQMLLKANPKPLMLNRVDTIFSLWSNFWSLFMVRHWWRSPVLFLLALIIWSVRN